MCGFTYETSRYAKFMGTKGELISTDFNTIELFTYCDEDPCSDRFGHSRRATIKTSALTIGQSISAGHGGGDMGIMQDLYDLLAEGKQSASLSDIRTSVANHLTVFAAELSRLSGGKTAVLEDGWNLL